MIQQAECDGATSYTVSVPKDTSIKYAKVFLWSDYDVLKPENVAEIVMMN